MPAPAFTLSVTLVNGGQTGATFDSAADARAALTAIIRTGRTPGGHPVTAAVLRRRGRRWSAYRAAA